MTSNDTAKLLYGGHTDNRAEGHTYFFTHGMDGNGMLTESSPAVIHCRGDAAFTAAAESFIQANPEATFPELVQAAMAYTLANQRRGARLFYGLDASTVATAKAFYAQLIGSMDAVEVLARDTLQAAMGAHSLKAIGPFVNNRSGLFNTTPQQLAAEALGFVSYDSGKAKRLAPSKVSLPASTPIERGATRAASRRPLGTESIQDNQEIMQLIADTLVVIAADTVYRSRVATRKARTLSVAIIKNASRYYGTMLVRRILVKGLTANLKAAFDELELLGDQTFRSFALEAYWVNAVGLPAAPEADFGGLLPGFIGWLADTVGELLKVPAEVQVAAGAPAGWAQQRMAFSDHHTAKGAHWFINVASREVADLRATIAEQVRRIERTRKGVSANGPIRFPALPTIGECGGQLAITAPKGRSNWLIKHSAPAIPQARQEPASGQLLMEVLDAVRHGSTASVSTADVEMRGTVEYRIDAMRFKA